MKVKDEDLIKLKVVGESESLPFFRVLAMYLFMGALIWWVGTCLVSCNNADRETEKAIAEYKFRTAKLLHETELGCVGMMTVDMKEKEAKLKKNKKKKRRKR